MFEVVAFEMAVKLVTKRPIQYTKQHCPKLGEVKILLHKDYNFENGLKAR